MFEPGQLVWCVDDVALPGFHFDMHGLRKGAVYTVRAKGNDELDGGAVVYLDEINRPVRGYRTYEPGYCVSRFRPLPDERLDIFRKALEPAPEKVAVYEIEAEMLRLEDAVEQSLQAIDRLGVGSA